MDAGALAADIGAVQSVGNTILTTIEAADPAVDLPAEAAATALALLGQLVQTALAAWSNASGIPITVESVTALLPNATPLPEPPAGS